jgi:hypothetical protein
MDRRRLLVAAAWLVGGAAAVRVIDGVLGGSPAAAAVLGAVLVDLLAGRAGVRWSERGATPWGADVRAGVALGLSAGLLVVLLGHALGWATVTLGAPGVPILFALLRVIATAARDELLLRWLPIALGRRAGVGDPALTVFVVATAVAPLALSGSTSAPGIALAAAQALLGARLALATAGAIAPAAAHAGLALALGPLTRGGALDATWWSGDPGPAPHAAGATGWVAVALVLLAAAIAPRIVRRPLAPAVANDGSEPT